MILERDIERQFCAAVKRLGGIARKFVSPGCAGVPDRLAFLPGGHLVLVELKRPGQIPRPLQVLRINELRRLGFDVRVLDSKEAVRDFERAYKI